MGTEQDIQLRRVSSRIGPLVLEFCREHWLARAERFCMAELAAYVAQRAAVAPESPGRILRMLARAGALSYRVVSRSASLYELTAVSCA